MFKHALIIDPSPADTKEIKQALLHLGTEKVTVAGRSTIGIEELRTGHKPFFDVIILDIEQPDAGDIEAVLNIRKEVKATEIPLVVLYHGELDARVMFRCLINGADEFVSKQRFLSAQMNGLLLMACQRRKSRKTYPPRPPRKVRLRLR
jgi:CheY-like chemotaxis protein